MGRNQAVTHRTTRIPDTAIAGTCPKCKTRWKFCRATIPQVDSCGFESYSFRCDGCASSFAGIVEPISEALLISLLEPASGVSTPPYVKERVNC